MYRLGSSQEQEKRMGLLRLALLVQRMVSELQAGLALYKALKMRKSLNLMQLRKREPMERFKEGSGMGKSMHRQH